MREYIYELFESTGELTVETIVLRMAAASILACFIYLSYRISHDGSIYSRKFNVSLVALTMITTTVMIVIGNNIALSLGMVGALSIVRFRTAIKDARDTMYIFWTIVVGICCGSGDYLVAGIGSAFVFGLLLLFGRVKNDNRMLLILRGSRVNESRIEALVFQVFEKRATLRVKNTTENSVEFIYEMSRRVLEKAGREKSVTDRFYELGGIEYLNIVAQNDDVSS
ncbi:MAG TPA: DUF4956 domain-containing protein [Candidatus Intestinimonas pullistercoris]|uniref:DUF4956 domain-containing protein n=1 Tax=Candidatus Intestinimonas pullistercoris TaxID=2838623 RepID=A0A9D2NYK9_9FIRM|nr:DUF4956 domain-containing protein [uncultured Intestinimonas sp.]HJC41076.1 DUF4956 domain-containing protein [Candidatus Intestinimonas pullistercoris]